MKCIKRECPGYNRGWKENCTQFTHVINCPRNRFKKKPPNLPKAGAVRRSA